MANLPPGFSADPPDKTLPLIRGNESYGGVNLPPEANYDYPRSHASGMYQIQPGTWRDWTRQFGVGQEYSEANQAPKAVQDYIAYKADQTWGPNASYTWQASAPPGGYPDPRGAPKPQAATLPLGFTAKPPKGKGLPPGFTATPPGERPARPATVPPQAGPEDPSIIARQKAGSIEKARATDPWKPDTISPEAKQTSGSISEQAAKVWDAVKDPGTFDMLLNKATEAAMSGIHGVASRIAQQPLPGLAPQLGMSETAANQLGRDINTELMRRGGEMGEVGRQGVERPAEPPIVKRPARPVTPAGPQIPMPNYGAIDPSIAARRKVAPTSDRLTVSESMRRQGYLAGTEPEIIQKHLGGFGKSGAHISDMTETPEMRRLTANYGPIDPSIIAHQRMPSAHAEAISSVAKELGVEPMVMQKHLGGPGQGAHIEDRTAESPLAQNFQAKEQAREAQSVGAAAAPGPQPLPDRPSKQFIKDEEHEFFRLRQGATADKQELDVATQAWPEILKNADVEDRLYRANEGEPGVVVKPEEEAASQQYIGPLQQEINDWFSELKKKDMPVDPERVHRMVKGKSPDFDQFTGAMGAANPIQGSGSYKSRTAPSLQERVYHVMEDDQGNRQVVAKLPSGEWTTVGPQGAKLDPKTYQGANPPQKVGDKFRLADGREYTIKNARTSEIEAATPTRYYKNLAATTIDELVHLRAVGRNVYNLERLRDTPEFQKYATKDWDKAPKNWISSDMPLFRDYKMDPKVAYVINDFWSHRSEDGTLGALAKINRYAVQSLFWSPLPHIMNVGYHWATARGWDWLPHQWIPLAQTSAKALKEVYTQGPEYRRLMREGSGLVYGGLKQQEFYRTILNRFGENVKREPWKWDPIARRMGYGPSDLVRMLYGVSSHALWSVGDVMMLQRTLELERKGMSARAAIAETERHIPNYRVPSEVAGSRLLAKILKDPYLTEFSLYHYGMVMSHARMIGDLVGPGKSAKERFDAVGNMFVTGLLVYYLTPAINNAVQNLSGNKNLTMGPKGSTTIPQMVIDMYNGDKDAVQALNQIVTLAPLLKTGLETGFNKNFFTGKPVAEPADLKGRKGLKGLGRAAAQEAEHLAGGLVSPYSTVSQGLQKGKSGVPTALAKQALGLREENKASKNRGKKAELRSEKARQKKPQGLIEKGEKRLEQLYKGTQ